MSDQLTMHIQQSIGSLEADGLVTLEQAHTARNAVIEGKQTVDTLGYELEVYRPAYAAVPAYNHDDARTARSRCRGTLSPYGFGVDSDGVYEIQSPVSPHPVALSVITAGIVKTGWLPEETDQEITARISIGTPVDIDTIDENHGRLIRLLRAIELLGNTTPQRLLHPGQLAELQGKGISDTTDTWASRGIGGVSIEPRGIHSRGWQGYHNRIELRTLQYMSLVQFSGALATVHVLVQALIRPNDTAGAIYTAYDNWLQGFLGDHKLPDDSSAESHEYKMRNPAPFRRYYEPYAVFLATGDTTELRQATAEATNSIASALGYTTISMTAAMS